MSKVITASNMDFIMDNTYDIEKSLLYERIRSKGISSVEFARVKSDGLLFVEAKESFPDPTNSSLENVLKYESQIDGVCEKFIHSLNMFSSIVVGVADEQFCTDFILPEKTSIVFVLVIKNYDLKGCRRIKSKLAEKLPSYLKEIWVPQIFVINHQTAIKRELAVA